MASDGPLCPPGLVSGRGTVRRSRMVEGQPRLRGRDHPPHDTVQIAKHLACGNTHRRVTVRLEPPVGPGNAHRPITSPVRLAIDLDRQPRVTTGAIGRTIAFWMLWSRFETRGARPPQPPKTSSTACGT